MTSSEGPNTTEPTSAPMPAETGQMTIMLKPPTWPDR